MVAKAKLNQFFAKFWEIDASKIKDNLELDNEFINNYNSLRFYQFIAAIESNFNVKITNLSEIYTFGDLIKNLKDKV